MRAVSDNWKEKQRANFVGESDVKITLDITDPEAVADASASSNTVAQHSKTSQVINDKDKTIKNYATLEQNFWCLDGSNEILPIVPSTPQEKAQIGDVGYVSGGLCKGDCSFNSNPIITLTFSRVFTATIPAITITWSTMDNEFAREFKLTVYNGETAIFEQTIENNTDISNIIYHDFASYNRITLEIIKWSKPLTRARLADIDLGLSKEFFKNEIISMSFLEEVDAVTATLPTNQFKFELDNSTDFFNPYNEEGFNKYLCSRQRVISKIGYYNETTQSVEWIQMGEYYLSDWNSPQNTLTAQFEANNLLSFLNNKRYIECYVTESGVTLYSLAENLLSNAGLRKNADGSNKWVISDTLQNITTTGILPVCTQFEALQYIAQAACCVLFCDNQGNIHIEPLPDDEYDYRIDSFNSYKFPEVEVQKILGKVNVNCYTNKPSNDWEELFNGILDVTGDETIIIEFSSPTLILNGTTFQCSVTGNVQSYEAEWYNSACRLHLYGCSGEVTVVINGKSVDTSSRIVSVVNDSSADDEQDIDNPLITSYEQAKSVGIWVKNWLIKRNRVSTDWRCDPRLNALDIISVQNKYEAINKVRATSISITYNGGFKGKMTGRLI